MINNYRNRSRQSIFCTSSLPHYREDADDRRRRVLDRFDRSGRRNGELAKRVDLDPDVLRGLEPSVAPGRGDRCASIDSNRQADLRAVAAAPAVSRRASRRTAASAEVPIWDGIRARSSGAIKSGPHLGARSATHGWTRAPKR